MREGDVRLLFNTARIAGLGAGAAQLLAITLLDAMEKHNAKIVNVSQKLTVWDLGQQILSACDDSNT